MACMWALKNVDRVQMQIPTFISWEALTFKDVMYKIQ